MANIIQRPKVAIAGEFDGSPYVGAVYTRAGNAVTVAANTSSAPHSDIIAFLNGYGSRSGRDLNSLLDTSKGSASTLQGGIDSDGFFYIESDLNFQLAASGTNYEASRAMLGFDGTETVVYSSSTSLWRLTASTRWQRGVFQLDYDSVGGLKINYSTGVSGIIVNGAITDPGPSFTVTGTTISGSFSGGDYLYASSSDTTYFFATPSAGAYSEAEPGDVLSIAGGNQELTVISQAHTYSATNVDVLPSNGRYQNLVTWLRVRGSVSDADDVYSGKCLEDAEYTAGNIYMTCVLEADGRVSFNYPSTQAAYPTLTSIQTIGEALFLRLGFDGTEAATTTTTNHRQLRGANRAPCVLATNRGYVELRREVLGRDDYTIMADGSVVSGGLTPIKGWRLIVRVYGPAHGYTIDLERHLREWWKYARRGLTIYPTFGDQASTAKGGNDTRRHVDLLGLYGTTARHNLFQTVEADEGATHFGKRVGGRLLVKRHPQDAQARREDYSFELDIHQDIMFRLLDDTSR